MEQLEEVKLFSVLRNKIEAQEYQVMKPSLFWDRLHLPDNNLVL